MRPIARRIFMRRAGSALVMSELRSGLENTPERIEIRHWPWALPQLNSRISDGLEATLQILHDTGRQEDEQLLFRYRLGLLLEEPSQNRHARKIGDTSHAVALRIDEDPADYHGFAIADSDLGIGFAAVDTWTSRIAPCANGVSCCANLHLNGLADFFRITRGNLRSHIQFQVRIHKSGLSPLEGGRLERDRFPL
jgi:hypothetical protein